MPALRCRGLTIPGKVVIVTLLISVIALLRLPAFAGCSEIEDLDDRYECYQEKYESATKQLGDVRERKEAIEQQINNLTSQISVTDEEMAFLAQEIAQIEAELDIIKANLQNRRGSLAEKVALRNRVVRNYSKESRITELEMFLGQLTGASDLTGFQYASLNYIFDKSLKQEAHRWIEILNDEIANFEQDKAEGESLKEELQTTKQSLANLKANLATQHQEAQGEQSDLAEEEARLEERIADLSDKQQSILKQKAGEGTISGYDAPEYKLPDPPFKPAFAAMSYGAYTHYNGMSQYGAKGRADDGKDYKDIIKFYYKEDVKEKDNFPDSLCVEGYGEMDFQEYLYGLAEMPSDWPMDALKAQAIAARSFAYRYEKQGKCICTTQSCQVFLKSKSDNPPDRWEEAVDETKDKIVDGDVVTYYSSTTGGYINNIGWDADGSWPNDAYEKKAKSPWFYRAWYTESYRYDSSTCGRSTPWLDMEEMTDILNAWVVWRKGSGDEKDHISPVTTSCWGGDPYSHSKMAEKADKYGDEYTNISSVSVDIGNNGRTSTVRFGTNAGTVSIDGEEFKTVFNLRAPAYVAFRSRLFDIEMEN